MKVSREVADAYSDQREIAPLLIREVTGLFESRPAGWHFEIRPKGDESFALKVESGRVTELSHLEDFVACMVVVSMKSDIPKALNFIDEFFSTDYRRPPFDDRASKSSSEFPFDDLRLYGKLRTPADIESRPIDTITFEIQVKTYLQHAWSIATHDLVYKFDRVSWARNRVAYQVKALLEHAELSIASIAELEASGNLYAAGSPETEQQNVLDIMSAHWAAEDLPDDRRRLATNVWALLGNCGLDVDELGQLLDEGRDRYDGEHPKTLSPFQVVLLYAAETFPDEVRSMLVGDTPIEGNYTIPVDDSVLGALELDREQAIRAFH